MAWGMQWRRAEGDSMNRTLAELIDAERRLTIDLVTSNRIGDGWAGWASNTLRTMRAEIARRQRADESSADSDGLPCEDCGADARTPCECDSK